MVAAACPPLRGVQAPRTIRRSSCVVIGERPGGEAGRELGSGLSPRGAWSCHPPCGVLPSPKGASCSNPRWLRWGLKRWCPLCPLGVGPPAGRLSAPPSQGVLVGPGVWAEHMGGRLRWAQAPSLITGWETRVQMSMPLGVWGVCWCLGCLLLVHSHAGQVPGGYFSGPPMGSAALGCLPTSPPAAR